MTPGSRRLPAIGPRRLAALVALLAAAGVAVALVSTSGSPAKKPADGTTAGAGAATVERRDLIETDTEAGTLSYAEAQTVYDRLSGTITWLPRAGQVIRPGGVLFAVDGAPVILMDGTTPAYRSLGPGTGDGGDVLQLNRDLVALGFDPEAIALDDEWQAATAAGVDALQRSLGEPETGKLPFGRIVFLPGDQVVSTVDATLGGDGGSSGSPSSSATSDPAGAGTREYAGDAAPNAGPPASAGAPAKSSSRRVRNLEAQLERLQEEVTQLRSSAGGTGSPKSTPEAGPGSAGASPTPVLQTTSTRLVVTVQLEASKQAEARAGEAVTVTMPNGEAAGGRITAVSTVAQASASATSNQGQSDSGGSGSSGSTVPVTIALDRASTGAGLDQAGVSVEFVQSVARHVLSVPVTALLATGGAGYAIQEAAPPHRLIRVTTGLFAAGDVQISGAGVRPGLQVSDSQG